VREIKFRGYQDALESFVYGSYVYSLQFIDGKLIEHWIMRDDGFKFAINDPETIGQHTGAIDVNGNSVYEGDIVCFEDSTSTESGWYEQGCIGVVAWCEETASFEVSNRLSAESYEVLAECRVIGNIYENPELLEVE